MYTYIDKGLFTARNIDLKRQAKFKPRKCHKTQILSLIHISLTYQTANDYDTLSVMNLICQIYLIYLLLY